jgi:hypothetical protein
MNSRNNYFKGSIELTLLRQMSIGKFFVFNWDESH